jgi:PGF-pre-PGF domain-containing protein
MKLRNNLFLLILTALFLLTFLKPVDAFDFYGYVYNVNGTPLNNTNISVHIYNQSDFSIIQTNTTLSNASGWFNLTGLPNSTELMFQADIAHFTPAGDADYVSKPLPPFPVFDFATVSPIKFYLKPGATINLTAYNSSGSPVAFTYMVKDTKLGFPIKEEFENEVFQVSINLPLDRNYSIMVYPNESLPISYYLTNLSSYPNNHADISLNTSFGPIRVSGYVKYNNMANFTNFTIIAYLLEGGDMIFEQSAMPFNISMWVGTSDFYNATTGFYNITLPAAASGTQLILFANAQNSSNFYGAFRNITLTQGSDLTDINFTVVPLMGEPSVINLTDPMGQLHPVPTKKVSFLLTNSTGSPINAQAHVELQIDYTSFETGASFTWMADVQESDNGAFSVILLNHTIDRINIYSSNFAPQKERLLPEDFAASPINLTLSEFDVGGIDENVTDIYFDMIVSNSTCDMPQYPQTCSLFDSQMQEDEFNPLSVVMGGGKISFITRKNSNNITIHYVDVDLLASGPPDVLFDPDSQDSTSGSVMESAWRFGSQGPEIYDYVIIGVPYNSSALNESKDINISISLFYDQDWNVIWNTSLNGTSGLNLSAAYSDYSQHYLEWEILMNGTTCQENISQFSTTNPCYKNTTTDMLWIRIPHFSGVGPKITGEYISTSQQSSSNDTTNTSSSSSSSSSSSQQSSQQEETTSEEGEAEVSDSYTVTWSTIAKDREILAEIENENIAITQITFTLSEATSEASLTVDKLESKPSSLPDPSNKAYQYIKITTTNLENVVEAKLTFKVALDWINNNKIDKNSIKLNRYQDGTWKELETTILEETDSYILYESASPGFSYFAITGKEITQEKGTETPQEVVERSPQTMTWAIIMTSILIVLLIILSLIPHKKK